MKTKLTDLFSRHSKQASGYALIGLSALSLELTLFYMFAEILDAGVVVANTISVGAGMFISFGLNAAYNFKVSDSLLARFMTYAIVVALGYLLSTGILLMLTAAGIAAFVAKLASLPFVFFLQYGLNNRYTFSNK